MQQMNRGIITALTSIGIAQAAKIWTHHKNTGEWDVKQLATTGGMPSSHSARGSVSGFLHSSQQRIASYGNGARCHLRSHRHV